MIDRIPLLCATTLLALAGAALPVHADGIPAHPRLHAAGHGGGRSGMRHHPHRWAHLPPAPYDGRLAGPLVYGWPDLQAARVPIYNRPTDVPVYE